MQGPNDTTELRELMRPREFPSDEPGTRPKIHLVQTPSDMLRERLYDAGKIVFGLVPDAAFQRWAGRLLYELAVAGEVRLCELHKVDAEHEELELLSLPKSDPPPEPAPDESSSEPAQPQSTGSVAVDTVLAQQQASQPKTKKQKRGKQ